MCALPASSLRSVNDGAGRSCIWRERAAQHGYPCLSKSLQIEDWKRVPPLIFVCMKLGDFEK